MKKVMLVAVVFVLALAMLPATSGAERGKSSQEASDQSLSDRGSAFDPELSARNIRQTFHLDSSKPAIDAARKAPAGEVVERMGVLMLLDEAARVDRQLELEMQLEDVRADVKAVLGDDFAGVWVDRDADGLTVTTTGDADSAREALGDAAPDVPAKVEVVAHSQGDLERISGELSVEAGVVSVARRPMDNQVVVSVEGDVADAAARLAERYGDAAVVEQANDASALSGSRTSGAPWEAGDEIRPTTSSNPTFRCTGGFGLTRNGTEYVMTAGHCKAQDPTWKVGTSALGTWVEMHVGDADVGLIDPNSGSWSGPTNCVYVSDTECSPVLTYRDPALGTTVCYSGARTGYRCGEVDTEREGKQIGVPVLDTLEASGFAQAPIPPESAHGPCSGDSGSPVFTPYFSTSIGVIARGILSYDATPFPAACTGSMGFSRWSNVVGALDYIPGCDGNWGENQGCAPGTYSDVELHHRFYHEIEWASDQSIAAGFADGTFRPSDFVARQAAAAWLWRQAGSPAPPANQNLTDVPTNHTFYSAITWAVGNGYLNHYTSGCAVGNKCFRPTSNTTRSDWGTALYKRAGSPYQNVNPVPEPAFGVCDVDDSEGIYKAVAWNMVTRVLRGVPKWDQDGVPCGQMSQHFYPVGSLRRQEALASLYNFAH